MDLATGCQAALPLGLAAHRTYNFLPDEDQTLLKILCAATIAVTATSAPALDDAHWHLANEAIEQGISYLRTTQKPNGSWSPEPGPAITALAATVMLEHHAVPIDDFQVMRAIDYILSQAQEDGGIYNGFLANYNTAICLTALSHVNGRTDVASVVEKAQKFLIQLQWADQTDPDGVAVGPSHPWFGGAGYGSHGRPDLSNTQIMLQGLRDSGIACDHPAFQRALVFIERCQSTASNDRFAYLLKQDGGFIYSTSIDKNHIGVPESKANPEMIDEAKQGLPISGLRSYGSMTYAGFKSYLYARLSRDDPRVVAARQWIGQNYTLDRNPGMPENLQKHGLYYMYMTMGRALDAWGVTHITTSDGQSHDWENDLVAALVHRQHTDGSWVNNADRWMEGNPNLVTCYALIALLSATR